MVEIYSSEETQVVPQVPLEPQDPHNLITEEPLDLSGHRLDNLGFGQNGEITNNPTQSSLTTPMVDNNIIGISLTRFGSIEAYMPHHDQIFGNIEAYMPQYD